MIEQKHTPSKPTSLLYTPAGFYMLRAPALPAQIFTQISAAGHISQKTAQDNLDTALQTQQNNCAQLLQELAAQAQISQALAVASPSLWEGLQRLQRGKGSPSQQRRAYASLLRYLIRMSTRPTPFGLFSGVACGAFADETQAHLVSPVIARFRTRPDMYWLFAVLQRVEEDRSLVTQLRVRFNQTAYFSGERVVLPFADTYGVQGNRAISLHATLLVRTAFDLSQQLIPYAELQSTLQQRFPHTSREKIDRVLWTLCTYHFLLSELYPPLTDAQPAEYVRKHLDVLEGGEKPKEQLARVLGGISTLDDAGIGAPISMISTLVRDQEELVPANGKEKLPLQVDSTLHVKTPLLHHSIGQAATHAAEFLLRQTPFPNGFRHLQEYRMLFLEKYSEWVEVPLLDLLSPENGLDAPPGYENPPRVYHRPSCIEPPNVEQRNQVLLKLVTEAVNKQSLEVELTEEIQQRLERWTPKIEGAPLSLEICLHLHAQSREAVDNGECTVIVGRHFGSSSGGSTFGRFFDLLGDPGIKHLRDLTRCEEVLLPDVIFAELSYQPFHSRWANVMIRPLLRSYEIAIGVTPSVPAEHVLALSDLVVGVQNGRFYLRSLRLNKQVRVCQNHMLNIKFAPNVCRFITEIASDGQPILTPFDWGAAASAPFLPRLVLKTGSSARVVITPACWQFQTGDITPQGEGSVEARWFRGLQQWREQWRVPRYVYLTETDHRLLLDLENPLMVAELHDELNKHEGQKQIRLDELFPDFEHLWLHDEQGNQYFSEIVVPLLRVGAVDPTTKPELWNKKFVSPQRVISSTERNRFPGDEWVYLKLYPAPGQHEKLLVGPLRELVQILQAHELIDRWFFTHYVDSKAHLRLCFHAKEAVNTQFILAIVLPWSLQLGQSSQVLHYALDTYEREVERYGGPDAIDLLEQVFSVDSVIVSDILAYQHARPRRLTLDPLAVGVFTLDHFFTFWGCDLRQRLEWVQQASEKYAFSKEFRSERKRYCDLLAPHRYLDPLLAEQRTLLLELILPQEPLLRALGTQVRQLVETQQLWVSENSLLSSLAHMHLNRLLGINQAREMQVYSFWRHTLDSLERRPKAVSVQT